jgi:general L-amino acid transport system permease protein
MAVFESQPTKQPPFAKSNVIFWLKENLFSSIFSGFLTIFAVYLLYLIIPPLANWMFFDATFTQVSNDQCSNEGACWSFVIEKINLFAYGFYPVEEYWRPQLVLALAVGFVWTAKRLPKTSQKIKIIAALGLSYFFLAFVLLYGGFGLEIVETNKWGGLMLTVVIAAAGNIISFPIGILLALGRQSKMKVISALSILYIEFIRGVPLITILFMASVVLPLFFSTGMDMDKLLRALIGITMFQAAYIAEVIRGGLQAIPKGQHEAANALGLNFMQKTLFVILPQALKISIPNIVGSFIALFKDTTLVLIIGLFDILSMVNLTTSDEHWLGRETEGYVFVTLVMWIILYSMSRYSKKLEVRFSTDYKN